MNPQDLDLTSAAQAIRKKEISSVELTRLALDRAAVEQKRLNCFISLEPDEAMATAKLLDAELAKGHSRGPLHGVPLAHKDMFYRKGRSSSLGSTIAASTVADRTSTALNRLDLAGQVMLGTLNMSEFAVGPTGHNHHWGHCRNPWNTEFVTGGSSSGSGAVVGARVAYGALGSDTGGSVRLPAGICGVTGVKPTQTRVSRAGMMPLSFSLDQAGPIAQSARDCALLLQLIAGPDGDDRTASAVPVPSYVGALAQGARGLRIGIPVNLIGEDVDEDVDALLVTSRQAFRGANVEVVPVKWPDVPDIDALSNVVLTVEAMTVHRRFMEAQPDQYQPQVRQRLLAGVLYSGTRYVQALDLRPKVLKVVLETAFAGVDAIQVPLMGIRTPTIKETDIGVGAGGTMPKLISLLTRFTRIFNYLGLPGVTVPCGFDRAGMPVAFQLIGRPFDEAMLLRLANTYQLETDWHRRRPRAA